MGNQGNRDRDREGKFGQAGKDSANPAGTPEQSDNWPKGNTDSNRPAGSRPTRNDEDEDSLLGNRTGFR